MSDRVLKGEELKADLLRDEARERGRAHNYLTREEALRLDVMRLKRTGYTEVAPGVLRKPEAENG